MSGRDIKLQILVSTYGRDGIERTGKMLTPQMQGVEYLVVWQTHQQNPEIPAALMRDDVQIIISNTVGLSKSRNIALNAAEAPIVLISDDDLVRTEDDINKLLSLFENHPECDIITFSSRYDPEIVRNPPQHSFDLKHPAKGYFLTSFELAFRRTPSLRRIRFNEWFGIGSKHFCAGEEEVFLADTLDSGASGRYFPETLVYHPGSTTSDRLDNTPEFLQTKGAMFYRLRPYTWPAALLFHAIRNPHPLRFIRHTFKGVGFAIKNRVFSAKSLLNSD